MLKIAFCIHLSLKYGGGGERWVVQLANELKLRGHTVEIYALPFMLKDHSNNSTLEKELNGVKYHEGYFHFVKADVIYIFFHPLNWLNFWVNGPKIGGMHSNAYWKPIAWSYGLLPNLAIIANIFTSKYELAKFKVIHTPLDEYPINHPDKKVIPNFVDSEFYKPTGNKPDQFTVGFASRKTWSKGVDIWEQLKPLLEEKGIRAMETGGLTDQQLGEFYNNCHVVYVPARVDTFGLSIIEAILWGKSIPLVSTVLAHRALALPLFYADTAESALKRILEIKEMWNHKYNSVSIYSVYADILYEQALRFDKKRVIDQLENMLIEVAEIGRMEKKQ